MSISLDNEYLEHVRTIELFNDEEFQITGYDDEGRLYLSELYWQCTHAAYAIDLYGNKLGEVFYEPEEGNEPPLELIPFQLSETVHQIELVNPMVDLTASVPRKCGTIPDGVSEKGDRYLHLTEDDVWIVHDYFAKHAPRWVELNGPFYLKWDRLRSLQKLKGDIHLAVRARVFYGRKKGKWCQPDLSGKVHPWWIPMIMNLEIGRFEAAGPEFETLHRYPVGLKNGIFNPPTNIVRIADQIMVADDGANQTRDRIHVFRVHD